jgi:hypothetical protein
MANNDEFGEVAVSKRILRKKRYVRLLSFSFLLSNNKTVEKIQSRVGIEPNNQRLTIRASTQTTELSRHIFNMYYSTVVSWLCYSMIIFLFDRRKEKDNSLKYLFFLVYIQILHQTFHKRNLFALSNNPYIIYKMEEYIYALSQIDILMHLDRAKRVDMAYAFKERTYQHQENIIS